MTKIVFIPKIAEAPDNMEYAEWSINTWAYWAGKNDYELVIFDTPIVDDFKLMKPTWQRWYVWTILEANGYTDVEFIIMADADTMIHWDAPDPSIMPGNYLGVLDDNNIEWTHNSIQGYKHLFPGVNLEWTQYRNNGVVMMDTACKPLCDAIVNFYSENMNELIELQHTTLRKGSDQTPVNYLVHKHLFEYNDQGAGPTHQNLSKKWNMTHLHLRGVLQNFMFIDMGWIWHFNGFEKKLRDQFMMETWNRIKSNYE